MTSLLRSMELDERGIGFVASVEPGHELLGDFFESGLVDRKMCEQMLVAVAEARERGGRDEIGAQEFWVDIDSTSVTFTPDYGAAPFRISLEDFMDRLEVFASYFDGRRELVRRLP